MKAAPPPTHAVIAHAGGPRDFWHTLYQGTNEGDALAVYRSNVALYTKRGGMRALKDGRPVLFCGPLGTPGEE